MPKVTDAREAEEMVRARYGPLDAPLRDLKVRKQGYTWIVTYKLLKAMGDEAHEVRINANTGDMVTIK